MKAIYTGTMPALALLFLASNCIFGQHANTPQQDPYFNPSVQTDYSPRDPATKKQEPMVSEYQAGSGMRESVARGSSIIREKITSANSSAPDVVRTHDETSVSVTELPPLEPVSTGVSETAKVETSGGDFRPNSMPMRQPTKTDDVEPDSPRQEIQPAQTRPVQFKTSKIRSTLPSMLKASKADKAEPGDGSSFEPGRVVAIVGGEPIFVGDILYEANTMIEQVMSSAPKSIKDKQRPLLIKRLIPKFVDAKLLYLSTIRGLPDGADIDSILEQADSEFDDKAMPILMEKAGVKSPIELDAHLRSLGSSLRKMRRSWSKEQLTRYFLSQQLQVNSDVTHQEMLDYYREHQDDYWNPARARWEQVMVRFSKHASRADAKKALVEMGNQIVYGAKLDAVARKSSDGFLAMEGGQHDWTTKGALVAKELDQALFSLPIGELSEIIETRDGYHILRVLERTEAQATPFLEAQVEIKEKLESKKREKAFAEHLEKVRQEIPYEIIGEAVASEQRGS